MGDYQRKTLRVRDGLRLAYRDYGPAGGGDRHRPAVVCLGGLTRNAKDFAALAPWLAGQGHRVLCPDYRGRGLSDYDSNAANYRPDVYLDDIRHLLIAAGVHRIVVIGTSLGGLLAMGMSAAYPTVLSGVVLNDIGPVVDLDTLDGVAAYIRTRPVFETFEQASEHVKQWFPDNPAETDAEWLSITRCVYKQRDDGKVVFDFDPAIGNSLSDPNRLPRIDIQPLFDGLAGIPIASIRGAKSDIFPAGAQEAMAERRPDMIRVTVPDVGHVPSLSEPGARQAIQELLSHAR